MFNGTITLVCSVCGKTLGHPAKDVLRRTMRICPICGKTITVPQTGAEQAAAE